jgi:tetratricopeptide (TPR) repeat protein
MKVLSSKKIVFTACLLVQSGLTLAAGETEQVGLSLSYQLETEGNYSAALKPVKPLLSVDESAEFANLRYAWLHYLQKNYNKAISYYKQALQLNPQSIDAKLGVSLVMLAQLRWKEAASYASQVLEQAPSNYIAHLRLIISYSAQKKWSKVSKQAKLVHQLYPTQTAPLLYLARSYVYTGKKEQAIGTYQAALLRAPSNFEAKKYLASAN